VSAPGRFASPQSYTPKHLAEKIPTSRSALEGERKQVTVLFVDVSGFTSLSERLDPEVVHRLMTRAFELMLAEVHRYEGTVNQFLGDGIMALFGAPIGHEDHAQCAAHAALGIRTALEGY
jgi:class 3 adenylate cyclase